MRRPAIPHHLFAAAVMMAPTTAWTGNATMMEPMAQGLVELNERVLAPLLEGISDGHYRLQGVILNENQLRQFRVNPTHIAVAGNALAQAGTKRHQAISIRRIDVPVIAKKTDFSSRLTTFRDDSGDPLLPTPLLLDEPSPTRSAPIGGGRALLHW